MCNIFYTLDRNNNKVGLAISHPGHAQHPKRVTLKGQHCRLEPLSVDKHGQQLFDAYSKDRQGEIWTYLFGGPYATFADYAAWVKEVENLEDPMFFAVIDQQTGLAMGVASYLRIDIENSVMEVGNINFSPGLQRSRAATETMYLMMQNAFALGFRRYEWKCDSLNEKSMRAAQRLGFSFEGIFRQAVQYKGRNRDTAWFAVTDDDWRSLSKAFEAWLADDNLDAEGKQIRHLGELTAPCLVRNFETSGYTFKQISAEKAG